MNLAFNQSHYGFVSCLLMVWTFLLPAEIHAMIEKEGAGSYLATIPKPCKPLPETIYRTADITGPMLTSQWWTSLVWKQYSQPLFAHPLVLQCKDTGLTVNYPGTGITGNDVGIFGGGGSDFTVGHSSARTFPQADCGGYSDWFVTAVFASGQASLKTRFGHGSPFVFCQIKGGNPTISFEQSPQVWSGDSSNAVLGITIRGHHYGLFGPSTSTWDSLESNTLTCKMNGKDYFTIALLPDNNAQTLAFFKRYAHTPVTDTNVEFTIEDGNVKADYQFKTQANEGKNAGTLFALYPHQWKYTTDKLTKKTYHSVRGTMKLGRGTRFSTVVPVQGVLPMLPAEGITDRKRMTAYLEAESQKPIPAFADTYWEGKYLGKLTTLSGIAEVAEAPHLQQVFVNELKRRLEQWFTATPDKQPPVFYYNSAWGTLVGSLPSYGSDELINDHHFHYGYFIRAAAEIARLDANWATQWKPMVELMIRDIASSDREDPMFPYIRCFDKYAGHSWASGNADFGDGNNQESSSESMNAWYGMILWGMATGNTAVRDTGIYLFNTERTAVEEYWFDVSGTNFPEDFPHVALGMIWGGKGAFQTWFSGDIDHVHGINWLPFTPASLYMGRHPHYIKKNHDRIVSVRDAGIDYNVGWGDLICMFNAMQDPDASAAYIDRNPNCNIESGNTHAFMYHWICTLKNLGLNDTGLTADYPLALVLNKQGTKTYTAYNFDEKPRTVTFSDNTRLSAKPKTLTVLTE